MGSPRLIISLVTFRNYSVLYMYHWAISRLKTGYFELLAGMAKGVAARGLVLNYTCCIDLLVCIAS